MRIKEYRFRNGSRLPKNKAEVAGQFLAELHNEIGELTPQLVLERASPKSSPIHSLFEWDDSIAAEAHRLWQARHLLREVVVVYESPEKKPIAMNAYVKFRDSGTPYHSMVKVMSDTELRDQLLRQALKEIQEWRRRYKDLEELAVVFKAVDRVSRPKKVASRSSK